VVEHRRERLTNGNVRSRGIVAGGRERIKKTRYTGGGGGSPRAFRTLSKTGCRTARVSPVLRRPRPLRNRSAFAYTSADRNVPTARTLLGRRGGGSRFCHPGERNGAGRCRDGSVFLFRGFPREWMGGDGDDRSSRTEMPRSRSDNAEEDVERVRDRSENTTNMYRVRVPPIIPAEIVRTILHTRRT